MLNELEQEHQRECRKLVSEFKLEMGKVGIEIELEAKKEIAQRIRNVLKRFEEIKIHSDQGAQTKSKCLYQIRCSLYPIEKRIKILEKMLTEKDTEITDVMIENARNYPISQLVEFRRNMAPCIVHSENHPSMSLKNNHVYCFGCGFKGDAIAVYMQLNGCDFKTAVGRLQ